MNLLKRTECIICNTSDLTHLHTFKHVPIFMGVQQPSESPVFEDQMWTICKHCHTVQLQNLIPLDVLYKHTHTPGTVGETWLRHNIQFTEFIDSHFDPTGDAINPDVVEVGAGSLVLTNLVSKRLNARKYIVIDPNADVSQESDIIIINEFIENVPSDLRADIIIHSHTMEHFYNPRRELQIMYDMLRPHGEMFISVPLIKNMIQHGYTNGLNFEHTYCTDEDNLTMLLESVGFVIEHTEKFSEYNIFIHVSKSSKFNTQIFMDYVDNIQQQCMDINRILSDVKSYYLFGAHVFSQTLLSNGLSSDNIISILDNDPNKHNKILYGTSLPIESPEILRDIPSPVVVVQAGQYTTEICKQLRHINPTVLII